MSLRIPPKFDKFSKIIKILECEICGKRVTQQVTVDRLSPRYADFVDGKSWIVQYMCKDCEGKTKQSHVSMNNIKEKLTSEEESKIMKIKHQISVPSPQAEELIFDQSISRKRTCPSCGAEYYGQVCPDLGTHRKTPHIKGAYGNMNKWKR